MTMIGTTQSVVPTNRFRFTCPTLGRVEFYLRCVLRRYRHWRGEEIEGDCATCMRASKCPAVAMIKLEHREGRALFLDTEGKATHRVPAAVMDEIRRKLVRPFHARGTNIEPEALAKLVRGDFDGKVSDFDWTDAIPAWDGKSTVAPESKSSVKKPPRRGDLSGVAERLDTDMAGAINRVIRSR
jgi:hypothetical protein